MAIVRGVDGCKAGWLCASLDLDSGRITSEIFADAQRLLTVPAAVTAIDIPIGLPGAHPRSCDEEARQLLGPRGSCVFPAPARATLAAESYETACLASETTCGKRLSQQTYAIVDKIRDVDAVLRRSPTLLSSVREVHPEVCFYFWNNEQPMRHPKRSGFGFAERYRLVEQIFGGTAEEIRSKVTRPKVSDDDILDALAALWTARRILAGTARRLPVIEERDAQGLPMQMLA